MAYFKELRKNWTDAELDAWKASWKIKKETWNKKRQPRKRDAGGEEEKEHEPPRERVVSKKTQSLMQMDDGTPLHHV